MATPKNTQNIGKNINSKKTRFKEGHVGSIHPNVIKHQFKKGLTPYNKGKKGLEGKNNPKWTGGKDAWVKKQAKIRDDYTCQVCFLRDPEIMEVDHIKQRVVCPELAHSIDNLVTLCPNCHRRRTNNFLRERLSKKHE